MRHTPCLLASAILALSLVAGAQPVPGRPGAPMPGPVRPAPAPPMPGMPSPAPRPTPPQPTLLQIDVYQVDTTLDRAAGLDLGKIGQNKPARAELVHRLSESGTARLIMRFDSIVNLNAPVSLTTGRRLPVVSAGGRPGQTVNYEQIGAMLNLNATWREEQPATADVTLKFELSSIGKTSVTIGDNTNLPSYNQLSMNQYLVLESGRPTLIMSSELPEPGDEKGRSVLTILNIMAQRIEGGAQSRPAEEASAGPQTLFQVEVFELTAKGDKFDPKAVEERLAGNATVEQGMAVLKKFGQVELISRPSILVNGPEEAEVRVGERVPIVQEIFTDASGQPKPNIDYKDIGLKMGIRGRWLDGTDPARAEVTLNIRQSSMGSHTVAVASGVSLPIFTERAWRRNVIAEVDKAIWVAAERAVPTDGNKMTLLLIRLTARRPIPTHRTTETYGNQ